MKLALLTIGGHKEPWLLELSAEYERKIRHFVPFEVIRQKPAKLDRSSGSAKREAESQTLLKSIAKEDLVILCDERGVPLDSLRFSNRLVQAFERGRQRVVVVVGGAFGASEDLRARADWIWSLSPLVLNHHIAQAVALEQLYRALTIWRNIPYHNE
ncbi:MAG: 23S rRNA (pseudouridine(1915)-N(3))-methyltransferase RlmH [Bdellovibrionaceae bacterium]|nr:23S rRNA (pseudouridine(1915)-N(3))-methyltransferase RlmH [Pseudobdellovibrionaceae bacterium]